MNTFVGIDPGANGGMAVLDTGVTQAFSFSKMAPGEIADVIEMECSGYNTMALIEKVHSMPGQGVVSMFNFGFNAGMLEGFLIGGGVPYERVTPQKWQKGFDLFKLPGETHTEKKNRHKALAQDLFPTINVTHAIADALLILKNYLVVNII